MQIVNFDQGGSGPIVIPAAGIDRRWTDSADGDGLCYCASGDGEAADRDIVTRFRIQTGRDVLQPSRGRNIQAKDLAIIGSATAESSRPVEAAVASLQESSLRLPTIHAVEGVKNSECAARRDLEQRTVTLPTSFTVRKNYGQRLE